MRDSMRFKSKDYLGLILHKIGIKTYIDRSLWPETSNCFSLFLRKKNALVYRMDMQLITLSIMVKD